MVSKRVTFLVDVDGTVANVLEAVYNVMKGLGKVSLSDRILYNLYKVKHRLYGKERGRYSKRYWRAYAIVVKMLKDDRVQELVKRALRESLSEEKVRVLKQMAKRGSVVLVSNSPHPIVKILADILREEYGINLYAFGAHPVVGRNKARFLDVLPSNFLEGPVVVIDNPTAEPQIREISEKIPHAHTVYVRDEWLGGERSLPRFSELNVEKLVAEAERKHRLHTVRHPNYRG